MDRRKEEIFHIKFAQSKKNETLNKIDKSRT